MKDRELLDAFGGGGMGQPSQPDWNEEDDEDLFSSDGDMVGGGCAAVEQLLSNLLSSPYL